jgi:hypothetical protein
VLVTASLARAGNITACGQAVANGDVGILQADLSCPAVGTSPAVLLNERSTLMLNGHTLGGGGMGVYCAGRTCRIYGPGEIAGSNGDGVLQLGPHGKIKISDVVIRDHTGNGIAIYGDGRLLLEGVTVTGNLNGLRADVVRVKGTNVTVSDNDGNGMVVGRYKFKGLTLQNNGTASSGAPGLASQYRGKLVDSTLSGNGQPGGVDIAVPTAPTFIRSTCERSGVWPVGGVAPSDSDPSLGICSLD